MLIRPRPDFGFSENETSTVSSSGMSPTMTLRRSSQVDREKCVLSQGLSRSKLTCHVVSSYWPASAIGQLSLFGSSEADGSGLGLFDPTDRKDADPRLNDENALNERLFCGGTTFGEVLRSRLSPPPSVHPPVTISRVSKRRVSPEVGPYKYPPLSNILLYPTYKCPATSTVAPEFAFDLLLPEPSCFLMSSATPSEFASGSSSDSVSGSAFRSAHGSFSTSPKRNKKFPISKITDEQAGPSTLAKFQDRLAKNTWEGVVSRVRTPVLKIREKCHIPSDYDIVIPATFDCMHRPPEGFSTFSIKHLDAGLRFPLAPPIASILINWGIEPSFDNFWSLYTFTTSKRSGSRGFFYLSVKPDCGYLSTLKSNVGVWLDRYIFIRSPRGVWPFKNEWTKYKLIPKISGGGLEGDQINNLTAYKYDPKKLLTEKVFQLFGLSPASLHIEESLDSLIMRSRNAMRMKAAQNKLRNGKQVAASSVLPPSSPAPVPSKARVPASPTDQRPITVDSEETPSTPAGHHVSNSSELELNLDVVSGDQGAEQEKRDPSGEERSKKRKQSSPKRGLGDKAKQKPSDKGKGKEPAEPSSPHKPKPQRSNFLSRMVREAAEKTSQSEDWDRFLRLAQLASWGDSFDLYDSLTSVRDQGSLVMNNPIRLEEFGAQAHLQDQADLRHVDDMMALGDKIKSLEAELDAVRKEKEIALSEKEVALSEAKKEAFEAGREWKAKLVALPEEHHQVLANSRMSAVRDFLKTDTFTTALEIKSADSFAKGYETCQAQIAKLGGFQESFDRGQLDITLDGDLQPYLVEPDLKDDEFMALRDELEAEANA
ncbi:UNVERIFIED_CONTAM: hypothetical protein Sindi_1674200 [Sesamum indicum]